ncbi:uncharacterized protein LOC119726071 [Patiria miniata]|uniref:PKD/REJ-like domain-containing protein n=1 Tax=Patiria miniata TaxID=46514 RepID=A0A913ZR99_PATMI|nr:uncharacterized protein LOC119726071 [Patiria miniata]
MGRQIFLIGTLAVATCVCLFPALDGKPSPQRPQVLRRGCIQMRLAQDGDPQLDLPDLPSAIQTTFDRFSESWLLGRESQKERMLQASDVQTLIEESLPKLALIDAYGELAHQAASASKTWGGIVRNVTLEYSRGLMQDALRNSDQQTTVMPVLPGPGGRQKRSSITPPPASEEVTYGYPSFSVPPLMDFDISERADLLRKLAYYGVLFFKEETTRVGEGAPTTESSSVPHAAPFESFLDSLLAAHISGVMKPVVAGPGMFGNDGVTGGLLDGWTGIFGSFSRDDLTTHETTTDSGDNNPIDFDPTGGLQFVSLLRTLQGQVQRWIEEDSPDRPALYQVNCSMVGEDRSSSVACRVCPPSETSADADRVIDSLSSKLMEPFSLLRLELQDVSESIEGRYRDWIARMRRQENANYWTIVGERVLAWRLEVERGWKGVEEWARGHHTITENRVGCCCLSLWPVQAQDIRTPNVLPIGDNDCSTRVGETMARVIEGAGFPTAETDWLVKLVQAWTKLIQKSEVSWTDQVRAAVETSKTDLMKIGVYKRLFQQIKPTLNRMKMTFRASADTTMFGEAEQVDLAQEFEKFGFYGLLMYPRAELLTQLQIETRNWQAQPSQREANFELYLAKIFALLANQVYDAFQITDANGVGFAGRTNGTDYSSAEIAARQKFSDTIQSPISAFAEIKKLAFNGTFKGEPGFTTMCVADTGECLFCGSQVFKALATEGGIMEQLESYHDLMLSADLLLAEYLQSIGDKNPATTAPEEANNGMGSATTTSHPTTESPVMQIIPNPISMEVLSQSSTDGNLQCKTLGFDPDTWQPDFSQIIFPEDLKLQLENLTLTHDWSATVAQAKEAQQELQGLLSGIIQRSSVKIFRLEAYVRFLQQTVSLYRHAANLRAQIVPLTAGVQSRPIEITDDDIFGSFQKAALITLLVTDDPTSTSGIGSFTSSSSSEFDTFTLNAIEKILEHFEAIFLPSPDHNLKIPDIAEYLQGVKESLKGATGNVLQTSTWLVYSQSQYQGDLSTFDIQSCERQRKLKQFICNLCTNSDSASQQFGENFATYDIMISQYHQVLEQTAQTMSEVVHAYLESIRDSNGGVDPAPTTHASTSDVDHTTESPGLIPRPISLSALSASDLGACRSASFLGNNWELDVAGILPEVLREQAMNLTRDRGWAERVSTAKQSRQDLQALLGGIIEQSSDTLVRVEAYDRFLSQTLAMFEHVAELQAKLTHSTFTASEPIEDSVSQTFHKIALVAVILYHETTSYDAADNVYTTKSSEFDPFVVGAIDMLLGYDMEGRMPSGGHDADVEGRPDLGSFLKEIKNLQAGYLEGLMKMMARDDQSQYPGEDGSSSPFEVDTCKYSFRTQSNTCSICADLAIASYQYAHVFSTVDSYVTQYHDTLEMKAAEISEQVDAYLEANPTTGVDGGDGNPPQQHGPQCATTTYAPEWRVVTHADTLVSEPIQWLVGNFSEILSQSTQPIRESHEAMRKRTLLLDVFNTVLLYQSVDPVKVFVASSLVDNVMYSVTSTWMEVLKLATPSSDSIMTDGDAARSDPSMVTGGGSVMPPAGLVANFGIPASLFFLKPQTVERLQAIYSVELAEISESPALQLLEHLHSDYPDHLESYLYTLAQEVLSASDRHRMEDPKMSMIDKETRFLFEELFGHLQMREYLGMAFRAVDEMWQKMAQSGPSSTTDAQTPAHVTVECTRSSRFNPVPVNCSVCWKTEAETLMQEVNAAARPAMEELQAFLEQRSRRLMAYIMPAELVFKRISNHVSLSAVVGVFGVRDFLGELPRCGVWEAEFRRNGDYAIGEGRGSANAGDGRRGNGTSSPVGGTGDAGKDGPDGSGKATVTDGQGVTQQAPFGGDDGGGTVAPSGGGDTAGGDKGTGETSTPIPGGSGNGNPYKDASGDHSTQSPIDKVDNSTQASDAKDAKLQNSTLASPTQGQRDDKEGSSVGKTATQETVHRGDKGDSLDGTMPQVTAQNDGDGSNAGVTHHPPNRGEDGVNGGTEILAETEAPITDRNEGGGSNIGITYPPKDQQQDGTDSTGLEETVTRDGGRYPQDGNSLGGTEAPITDRNEGGGSNVGITYPPKDQQRDGTDSTGLEETVTRGGGQYPQDGNSFGRTEAPITVRNDEENGNHAGITYPKSPTDHAGPTTPSGDRNHQNGKDDPGIRKDGTTPSDDRVDDEVATTESSDGEGPHRGDGVTEDGGDGETPNEGGGVTREPDNGDGSPSKGDVTQEPGDGERPGTDGETPGVVDATREPVDGETPGPDGERPDGETPGVVKATQEPGDGETQRPGPDGERPDGETPGVVKATQEPGDGETRRPGPDGERPDGETPGVVKATQEPGDGETQRPGPDGERPDGETPGVVEATQEPGDRETRRPGPDGERPDGETPGVVDATQDPGDGDRPDPDGERPTVEIPKVVAIVSGPHEIPFCGSLLVRGSASVGPSLTYTWAITSSQGTSEALSARLKTINDNNYSDLKLAGELLTVGVMYTVTLTVSGGRAMPNTATHKVRKLPEAVMKPGLEIRHRRLGDNNVVLASKRVVLVADVQFYSSCIESSSVDFIWTVTGANGQNIPGIVPDVINRGGRNQRFWAHKLPVGQPITISVAIPPNGETVLVRTTTSITITVQRSDLVASIKGGNKVTVGRDAAEKLSLDASESYDPDNDEARLSYSWSCTGNGGESSDCTGLPSALDKPVLEVTPSSLSVGSYTFVVTVSRSQGEGEATARVMVEVDNGDPPQMKLRAPFMGMFKPSRRVVVNAGIRKAALVESVEWRVLGETVQGATTSIVKKPDTVTASFSLPAGVLSAGRDYTISATAKDSNGNTLTSGATTITIYKGVTGCELQLISTEYRVFEIIDINVVGCMGEGQLSYKAFVAPSADSKKRQVLTTSASDQSRLNQDRAVEVPDAATVAIIVKVCDETRSCQVVSQEGIAQVKEATEQGIQAVKNARMESVQKGDFVGAVHQNGMLVKYGPADSTGRRRRRGAYEEARDRHHAFFLNATSDFPNLDVSQWDSVAVDLDSFLVEEMEAKLDAVDNIQTMLTSYLELNPEEFDGDARDSILKKIGEVMMDLTPDTQESRDLIRRCRTMIRQITTHAGRGLAEGDSITTPTGRSTVHIKRLTLQASQAIQAGTTMLKFPPSLEHIGTSVTLNVEEYDDTEDFNSETSRTQPLSGPIRSITMQDENGVAYNVVDIPDPIEITFPQIDGKHICLYYDDGDKMWSKKGLTTKQARAGDAVTCQTSHLTDFAIAGDVNNGGVVDPNKGTIVPIAGLTVAAVAGIIVGVLALLVIVVLIVFMVLKVSKNKKVNPKD